MPVNMPDQLEPNWCWAAVTVSVKAFFTPASTMQQCDVATPVLIGEHSIGAIDCCANRDLCNIPARLQDALDFSGNLRSIVNGDLPFERVMDELNAGHPVGVRIQWPSGTGHFLLIDGYRQFTVGPPVVHVADPQYQDTFIFYDTLVHNYQHSGGVWTDTFLLQR